MKILAIENAEMNKDGSHTRRVAKIVNADHAQRFGASRNATWGNFVYVVQRDNAHVPLWINLSERETDRAMARLVNALETLSHPHNTFFLIAAPNAKTAADQDNPLGKENQA